MKLGREDRLDVRVGGGGGQEGGRLLIKHLHPPLLYYSTISAVSKVGNSSIDTIKRQYIILFPQSFEIYSSPTIH